jgi:1,4-dihydroxy-2-naphthoate octaprenyltransferase
LRTLPLAVAPVAVGTGAAIGLANGSSVTGVFVTWGGGWRPTGWGWTAALSALLALVVSLALQVGVNYANDYSDGIRGTDDERVGPFRLTGSRAATPREVKFAAFAAFAVAALAGLVLVWLTGQWWLLLIGLACVLAAWYYTGGRRPYGYAGLGEVAVFIFFGLVAVLGTTYTQAGRLSWAALAGAVGVGSLACAVLVANNLRDVPTDGVSGKITLAVRLGDTGTRRFYLILVVVPFIATITALPGHPWAALALIAIPLAGPAAGAVKGGAQGLALLPVLRDTGRLALVYALLLAVGLSL